MKDGEVPVQTIGRARREHIQEDGIPQADRDAAAARLLLEDARQEIDRLQRGLKDAQQTIDGLRARAYHAEQARDEARTALRVAQMPVSPPPVLRPPVMRQPELPIMADEDGDIRGDDTHEEAHREARAAVPVKARRGRKKQAVQEKEPQPVKWWLKSKD